MPGILSHTGLLGGKISGASLQSGVCVTAASGFLLFGYDQGVMSGIITEPRFLQQFPQMDPQNKSGAIQALVVAIYEIGCLLGSGLIIFVGDKLGRRKSVLIGTLIMLVGTALQATASTLGHMIVGRIVTGFGNGMNTSSIPVWQSEMAPPKIRGFLVLFEGALITGGIMISYWINYGFWFVDQSSFQWRFPIAFQAVFGIMLIIGVLLYPESPRWLIKHGNPDAAREILAVLEDKSPEDLVIIADVEEMDRVNKIVSANKLTPKELFSNGKEMNLWRLSVACLSQAFQQLGGLNLVTYYATTVFEGSLQFDAELSRLMTGFLGTEFFLAALVALFVVDRLGRRVLMLWGAIGMGVCLLVVGTCLSQATPTYKAPAYIATVFIFIYNTFFAIGWLGVTWLYPAEVTPIRIRAEANGFSTCSNWLINYAVVQLAPIMINKIAWKTYFVFMCFNFFHVPVVYWFFPETNGYKLEAMDAIFEKAHETGENPVWTERRVRKGKDVLDIEKHENHPGSDSEPEGGVRGAEIEKEEIREEHARE
ncbi:probable sugar transporter STL1 [Ramularia collo-cygni]|uniref:Probable sugar transporter STL1 n=1 Tax=Ramularia collo-cygni TaxID=112498 RepID=A0A2D3VJF8_9PEZI|nr:probable sugar transporter STL1 [Ramularia collo-cygni]CZT25677.1 probable sugar transporter STL1 [Ramularia collo-cygni]